MAKTLKAATPSSNFKVVDNGHNILSISLECKDRCCLVKQKTDWAPIIVRSQIALLIRGFDLAKSAKKNIEKLSKDLYLGVENS